MKSSFYPFVNVYSRLQMVLWFIGFRSNIRFIKIDQAFKELIFVSKRKKGANAPPLMFKIDI